MRDYRGEYPSATHRPVEPCNTYNCHGLTFAARRTWIHEPSELRKIIDDDDYEEVTNNISPGDVAIYMRDGDYQHSGIVVRVDGQVPWILSKWGQCHEVIHSVMDCPYNDANVTYYRIRR